jgi:hypothetical protein
MLKIKRLSFFCDLRSSRAK